MPLICDKNGIPRLSKEDIETKAEEVIEFFQPDVLREPICTPINEFVLEASSRFGFDFIYSLDLGKSNFGHKILGAFQFDPRAILIDRCLIGDKRFPFVLAHEFGHLVFHRKLKISSDGYSDVNIQDSEYDFVTGRKLLTSKRDWLEWQANRFSSAILMPQKTLQKALISVQKEMGITGGIGQIYLEAKGYSFRDFSEALSQLQDIYHVTHKNLEYRLAELGLLIDRRNKDVKHISELLMEQ